MRSKTREQTKHSPSQDLLSKHTMITTKALSLPNRLQSNVLASVLYLVSLLWPRARPNSIYGTFHRLISSQRPIWTANSIYILRKNSQTNSTFRKGLFCKSLNHYMVCQKQGTTGSRHTTSTMSKSSTWPSPPLTPVFYTPTKTHTLALQASKLTTRSSLGTNPLLTSSKRSSRKPNS